MQASLLAAAARTAEVAALKRDLERSKEELGLAKRQLEENKGNLYPVCMLIRKNKGDCLDHRIDMNFARGHDRSGDPKDGIVRGEDKAAKERIEREKQEARVREVQQELQALVKKHESLELDSKTRESELAKALESAQHAKADAQKAL